ncbi:hypothetical protein [Mesobacillus zeae]|uniref:Holin n=1 Tax=Mesobacillus zeae TaxID=1917180 RepID=A0A398B2Z5_9BACI|nr:hypothetical protein [Mesobacillus zeae]RID84257.1 hypothetical protein D1970_13255 [Mesobacillus zeae]
MDFPVIYTNIWDVVFAVPAVMLMTQVLKKVFRLRAVYVPAVAVLIGLIISILISHRQHLLGALFMGYFYGYGAIGSYAAIKTSLLHIRTDKKNYS